MMAGSTSPRDRSPVRRTISVAQHESKQGNAGEIMWDANQYNKFAAERSRPFVDLLAQVHRGPDDTRHIVDLGCGPGTLTRQLAERWPEVRVVGIDNSPEMLAKAQPLAIPGRLDFVQADLSQWSPPQPVDFIFSNAALHWIDYHAALLTRLAGWLAPSGTLAVQMPNRFDGPIQQAIDESAADPLGGTAPGSRPAQNVGAANRVVCPATRGPGIHRQRLGDDLHARPHGRESCARMVSRIGSAALTGAAQKGRAGAVLRAAGRSLPCFIPAAQGDDALPDAEAVLCGDDAAVKPAYSAGRHSVTPVHSRPNAARIPTRLAEPLFAISRVDPPDQFAFSPVGAWRSRGQTVTSARTR